MKKVVNRTSVSLKIWTLAILVFALVGAFQYYGFYSTKNQYRDELRHKSQDAVRQVSRNLQASIWLHQIDQAIAMLDELEKTPDVSFLTLQDSSRKELYGFRSQAYDSLINAFSKEAEAIRDTDAFFLVKEPVAFNDIVLGHLLVGFNHRWLNERIAAREQELMIVTAAFGALLLLLTLIFSYYIAKPQKVAARILREYQPTAEWHGLPLLPRGNGETARLIKAFNYVADEMNSHLRENSRHQQFLESFFTLSPIAILITDTAGKILRVNKSAVELFETGENELLRKSLEELLGASDYYSLKQHFDNSNRSLLGYVTVVMAPDQTRKVLEMNIAMVENNLEDRLEYMITIIDVTEKIDTQYEILESQKNLSKSHFDLQEKTDALEAASRKNQEYAEKLKKLLQVYYQTIDCNTVPEILDLLIANGSELINARYCAVFLWDYDKSFLKPVRALPEAHLEKLSAIDGEAGIIRQTYESNQAYFLNKMQSGDLQELGFAEDDEFCLVSVPISDQDFRYGVVVYLQSTEQLFTNEDVHLITTLTHQAAIMIEKINLLQAYQGNYRHPSQTDILLPRPPAQYLQNQKMESMGTIIGGVAHEFNNILGIIQPNLDLLKREAGGDASIERRIGSIREAVERAAGLTRRLMLFSRNQQLNRAPVSLNKLVEQLAEAFRKPLGKSYKLKTELEGNLPDVYIDRNRITQVLMNLVVNARDAMPDGGEITIRTSIQKFVPNETPTNGKKEYVQLTVGDNGPGIADEQLFRIFDPFFTTREVGKGVGLGLSEVYGIIKSHGGSIRVDTALQQGTTFHIYLAPFQEADINRKAGGAIVPPTGKKDSGRILVVDDEAMQRASLKSSLEYLGYAVVVAEGGKDALAILQDDSDFDIAIVDYNMPEMDGVETIRNLRKMDDRVNVILTSGTAQRELLRQQHSDIQGFLSKPYHLETLEALLNKITNGAGSREEQQVSNTDKQ